MFYNHWETQRDPDAPTTVGGGIGYGVPFGIKNTPLVIYSIPYCLTLGVQFNCIGSALSCLYAKTSFME
ncbi:hypothetical protein CLNEO_23230 [Anaerotignum neopropionicum]|uniref:Uncharacterized protein n=1 Tax=Anaerotignum neopropionicum TaxID=36847 RepID=A0A136WDH6_9FIRM|nr:hypothetical protein CLNEO_23230 [Anaerotignum neopropionicum]